MNYRQPQIGINWYPNQPDVPDSERIHLVPYTFGLRTPKPADETTWQGGYDQGYATGAYDASVRVGTAALAVGAAIGVVAMIAFGGKR